MNYAMLQSLILSILQLTNIDQHYIERLSMVINLTVLVIFFLGGGSRECVL